MPASGSCAAPFRSLARCLAAGALQVLRDSVKQAANLHELAGDLEAARRAEAQADAPPGQGPGLGRWFAIAGGLAVGIVVLVVVVAAALGLF